MFHSSNGSGGPVERPPFTEIPCIAVTKRRQHRGTLTSGRYTGNSDHFPSSSLTRYTVYLRPSSMPTTPNRFEAASNPQDVRDYSDCITHETLRVAVCAMVEDSR